MKRGKEKKRTRKREVFDLVLLFVERQRQDLRLDLQPLVDLGWRKWKGPRK